MSSSVTQKDWDLLFEAACQVAERAYAPYSKFRVGAAAMLDDGRIVAGCNVENAGYGVTLCAECGLISELVSSGGGTIRAFVCVDGAGNECAPCGRCRQLLFEFSDEQSLFALPSGICTVAEMLPDGFGPRDLSKAVGK